MQTFREVMMAIRKVGFRVGVLVLGIMGVLFARPEVVAAQGPPPAGIRAEVVHAHQRSASELLGVRRRSTPVGRGALIGAIAGAAFGYLGTTEAGRGMSDGSGDRISIIAFMGALGAGIGALVAHIVNDD